MTYSTEDVVNYTQSSPTWHVSRNNDLTKKMGFVLSKTTGWQPILVTLYLIQYWNIRMCMKEVTIITFYHTPVYIWSNFRWKTTSMKGRRKCSKEVKLQTRTTMSMKTPNWTTQVLCQLVYELRCMYWAVLMKNEIWQSSILRSSASFAPQTRIN